MPDPSPRPTLTIYRRPGCHLCDEAEELLRDELAIRTQEGLPTPTIEHVDISGDANLEARYGQRIPVFAIADEEIGLVTSSRQIRGLLERTRWT